MDHQILTCSACGRQTNQWHDNRCPVCDALHNDQNELARFDLEVISNAQFVTGIKSKVFGLDESDLRKAVGLWSIDQGTWQDVLLVGSYKSAVTGTLFKWGEHDPANAPVSEEPKPGSKKKGKKGDTE